MSAAEEAAASVDAEKDPHGRTPEEIAADKARHKADLERERMKHPDPTEPLVPRAARVDNGEDLKTTLARIAARAQTEGEAELKALSCYPGIEAGDEEAGVVACEADEAWKTCRWSTALSVCPRARQHELYETVVNNFQSPPAAMRVPERESTVILASVRRKDREKLWPLDSLQVVRAALTRTRRRVPLENGAEVRREPGAKPTRHPGEVFFVGNEVIVVLAGNQGRGKTLAASYAIARQGGVYTRAPQWTRPRGVDVELATAAPVLVIDQFGREHWGDSKWSLSQLEDVLDARSQSLTKWTFLVGNLSVETFLERLKDTTIADRIIGGYGVFVEFGGESVRAGMRSAALKAGGAP